MSKERSGSISGAGHAIRTRTENTMETYHFAVNDLESEIVRLLLDTSVSGDHILLTPLPR